MFYEIHGSRCLDLLNHRAPVLLRCDAQANVHVCGARRVLLRCLLANELELLLTAAVQLRSSEATERNPISSRSHAVCSIEFLHESEEETKGHEAVGDADAGGSGTSPPPSLPTLTLVDLAGSERNYETTRMTAAQHKQSALINLSLMALKDCFQAYHQQLQTLLPSACVPTPLPPARTHFRASALTRVLRRCFSGPAHHTTVIATLSPSPIDLLHSLNSLGHVVKMCPVLETAVSQCVVEVSSGRFPHHP